MCIWVLVYKRGILIIPLLKKKGKKEMIEKIGEVLYEFEEKHPIMAEVIGFGIVYMIGLLITLAVLIRVL